MTVARFMQQDFARKVKKVMPAQIRAARALLGWSRPDLAKAAGVSARTVAALELDEPGERRPATVDKVAAALEAAGIRFTRRGVELSGKPEKRP